MSRSKATFTPGTPLPDHWFHILLALADDNRLKRMTDEGLVAETEAPADFVTGGGRPRFYRITPLGVRACKAEADRHARLVNAARAKRILRKDA
jgi:hypothetical protein